MGREGPLETREKTAERGAAHGSMSEFAKGGRVFRRRHSRNMNPIIIHRAHGGSLTC